MIFVNIYSYRDLELDKTIKDLFDKADKPKEIRVGVLNADDEDYIYDGEYNVDIINKPYEEYHGCGRACYEIQTEMYNNEDYFFKIDPHSRFVKGWDTYYKSLSNENTVLTSRCLGYHIDGRLDPRKNHYSKPVGWHNIEVVELTGVDYTDDFIEVIFMQAGCIFAPKGWVDKVGHDPYVALWGEETDISLRTYLAGYKMLNVPPYVYHLYDRQNRKGVDNSAQYELLNRIGIERVKVKLGLRKPDNDNLLHGWRKWGCDGSEYKKLLEKEF